MKRPPRPAMGGERNLALFDEVKSVREFTLPKKVFTGVKASRHRAIGQQTDVMGAQPDEEGMQFHSQLEWLVIRCRVHRCH